jgi:hypothetical protein
MGAGFRLLAGHFFGRFFDNEIVSQDTDIRTNVVQALGILASPGMFIAFYMLPQMVQYDRLFSRNWMLVSDYYFFVLYSMVVMGFVMVLEWDSFFPDRKDYLVLTPLPLGSVSIFLAKVTALLLFLGLFIVDTNVLSTVLAPLISGGNRTPVTTMWRLMGVHAVAVGSAGLFVALSFAALQGLFINILTGRAFRRISPWLQMASMGLMITMLFLTPLACGSVRMLFEGHSPLLRWFPPFWFLALYVDMLPGQPGGAMFHELAPLATRGLGYAAAAFGVTYLLGYRRHAQRVMESLETSPEGPGRLRAWFTRLVNERLVPHPLERATFHFISNTILRSARHRLFLAMYGGIAFALTLQTLVRIEGRGGMPMLLFVSAGMLSIPLTLSFLAVTGLRAAFNLPVELRANWVFQVCENEERVRHIRAARKWIVVMGLVPLFALLAPFEIWLRGWRMAAIHLSFAFVLSLVLLNLLLVWFRKIPFTCAYFPGKTSMAVMAFLYVMGFIGYAWTMAGLEAKWLQSPPQLILFYVAAVAALWGLEWLEERELGIDDMLIYEDEPDPIVRELELG